MKTRELLFLSTVLLAASHLGCSVTSGGEMARVPSVTNVIVMVEPCTGAAATSPSTEVALPSSCAEAKARDSHAGDGEYAMSVRGHEVSLYCKDMAGTPAEYLTLKRTSGGANTSYYGEGQNTGPGGLTTSYSRVRFHPDTLTVDWKDATFASSTGWNSFGKTRNTTAGWGNAGDCVADRSSTGTATIDLRGTPFAVAPGQFSTEGWNPAGGVEYSAGDQVVKLRGGGYCGGTGPKSPNLQLAWVEA